ncbi:exinuclease ABC system, subunit C [Gottschalkia acidurici 9a]|uniref:Exinuclease ABC system, subunit C n=1 Tax=Gottschalkia acidurici (strain ATCC 7906 / DSM 604 / BCRC 14475 / CIP 104303 / KCTC 5404 / NCIMB 10678 / 9a) TaxID=1128398 RepID=K0B1B1_GOTA9|nr:GIY-YIG nuclease family protein [Gottschalkia acidurici]AFS79798.1 exinuclease ABC system, subunit C [Gottschalkia acidurici 9a]
MDLSAKIKNLPSCSGVYLMKDSLNGVIYVGKSKNLKNRVSSYFQNSKSHTPKVIKLVKNLKDFDYITTDTEFEAFMLECKLIKEIKPLYNKLMKSSKSYCYIKIKFNEKHPYIDLSSVYVKDDDGIYFGPYTSKSIVERAIQGVKEYCKILCTNESQRKAYCLYYSLGFCIGMCLDKVSKEKYFDIFNKIVNLFNGTDESIIKGIELNMNSSSKKSAFEKAIKYRDYLASINYVIDKAKVVKYTEENKNIVLLEYLSDDIFKFFLIKGNKVLFSDKYIVKDLDIKKLKYFLKNNILSYFNNISINDSIKVGREEVDESQIIYTYLENKSNDCRYFVVLKQWLKNINDVDFDHEIDKLLLAKS